MRSGGLVAVVAAVITLATACGVSSGSGPQPGFAGFADAQQQASGHPVNLYMYGGDQGGNNYVDQVLAPAAEKLGITVHRVPVNDTATAIQKILGDKQAGRTSGGAVDLLWVNGENFRTGKQAGLWYCGWTGMLPNNRFVDWSDSAVANDFGTPVDQCEAPWSRAQFSFVYDSARVPNPPRTMPALLDWIRAHPGRFTYPAPPDFTGSVFMRQVLYSTAGGYNKIPASYDKSAYDKLTPALWSALQGIAPDLWRGGTTYPTSSTQLNDLYAAGQVDFTMTYGPAEVDTLVKRGTYPPTTRAYTVDEGTIGNTSYLAIPANAAHRGAAVVVANLALSPEQQLAKAGPDVWGQYPGIDVARTEPEWQQRFAALPQSVNVPPFSVLAHNAQPELQASWTTPLDDGWRRTVLAK